MIPYTNNVYVSNSSVGNSYLSYTSSTGEELSRYINGCQENVTAEMRPAAELEKDSFDSSEIVELLSVYGIKTKLPSGDSRPLVSISLEVVRSFTQTHSPSESNLLLMLYESIYKVIVQCIKYGMRQNEITFEIFDAAEVDGVRLDEFLHEFMVKEG